MKVETLAVNEKALDSLANIPLSNVQLAWDMSEAIVKAKDHIKRFTTKRDEIIQKLGIEDEKNPGRFFIKATKTFNEEMDSLLNVDVNLVFPSVSISDLKDFPVSAADIAAWKELEIITK